MFITSWTIDIRMNIQIWLLYRRYKSEWYNFWWATIQDIAACACKVWTLFGQACGQEECSQTTMMTTMMTTTDKSWLHRLATDILSWAKKETLFLRLIHIILYDTLWYKPLTSVMMSRCKNRSIGPELMTSKTGPIHLSSLVEIAFVDWFTKLLLINISIYMNI